MPHQLVLASTSTYKHALLSRLKIPFARIDPKVDETSIPGEKPATLALRLAVEKALAGSREAENAIVIGADQVAACDDQVFGKPGTAQRAREQLAASSGRSVHFHTAVALARNGTVLESRSVDTIVSFRELTEREIDNYIRLEEPFDCAGSFRWESLGIALFRALRGEDPTALEGLPLITVTTMLNDYDIKPLLNN